MNAKRYLIAMAIILALIASGYSLALAQANLAQKDQEARSLVGAWVVTAAFDPEFETPPFSAPAAFTKDQLVINSGESGLVAIGAWEKIGSFQYAITFVGYEVAQGTDTIHYWMKATCEISQDGNHLSGRFSNDIYDADDNLLFTITGAIEGERIEVVPME